MLPACLIAREPSYRVPSNTPPSIEEAPDGESPFTTVLLVRDPPEGGGADAGMRAFPRTVPFEVVVRDPDVDQGLVYQVFVNYSPGQSLRAVDTAEIPPSNGPERPVAFSLDVSAFDPAPSCNRVELLVSSAFQIGVDVERNPAEPGDLGTAVWWVGRQVAADLPEQPIDLANCPRLP